MPDYADQPGEMPAEHDFSGAAPNPFAPRVGDEAAITIQHADGTVEARPVPPRPEAAPDSLTGIFADTLHYIYNPHDDVLAVRLMATLTEPVTATGPAQDYQLLTSDETGRPAGLIIFGYLRRLAFLAPLLPVADQGVSRDLVERGLEPLRELLPAA